MHGIEFSPDNSKLYATYGNRIYQYNLSLASPTPVEIAILNNSDIFALQLAPDNKIYCVTSIKGKLSVIENPDNTGAACNFKANAFDLAGRTAIIELPNFIQSYFSGYSLSADFTLSNACIDDHVSFAGTATDSKVSWSWDFGDPDSKENNTSDLPTPSHRFTKPGTYSVTLMATNACGEVTSVTKQVNLFPDPLIQFPRDTLSLCYNEVPVALSVPAVPNTTYQWSTGATNPRIQAASPGWYTVTASNPCRTRKDSIYLHITQQATAYLPDDTIVCDGKFALLDAKNTGASYLWNTGQTTRTIEVNKPGQYWVEIRNACSMAIDTANLVFISQDIGSYTTNVFTPNGDGVNDNFVNYVINSPGYRMQIANRWGKTMFQSTGPFDYWDGKTNGMEAPAGVYFYYIASQDCKGQPLQIRGSVTLLR
jgi:gliding motility-associated-like protein